MHDDSMPPPTSRPATVPDSAANTLDIRVVITEAGPVMMLSGEADVTTRAQLEDMLNAQIAAGARILTVDLSGLRFADSATIGALARAACTLKSQSGQLDLLNPQPGLARVLALMGVDELLKVRRGISPGSGHPVRRSRGEP